MTTKQIRATSASVAVAAAGGFGASPARAVVRDCRTNVGGSVPVLNLVTITSARNMKCREAAIAVKRGPIRTQGTAARVGGRFIIGRYTCTTTAGSYESFASRCVRGARAFRIAWGS